MSATGPRSLADDLRARDDAALAALLRARPDLLSPVPADSGQLAARATTQASVRRALDRLDAFTLQVVEVLAALPEPTKAADVRRLLGADPAEPLATLRERALVWGPDTALRLVRTARAAFPEPAGLGPAAGSALATYGPRRLAQLLADLGLPAEPDPFGAAYDIAGLLADPKAMDRLLADAPAEARAVLERLTWGPPSGRVADAHRDVTAATVRTPVDWLLARGLLVATEPGTVVMPREVAVHLRGGHVHARVAVSPPEVSGTEYGPGLVDRTAASGADAFVRLVDDLLEAWGVAGPTVLRAGGLGVRELRRAAELLDVDETTAAFVVETAYAAGLLARDSELEEAWRPTPAFDVWAERSVAHRWETLASAWLVTTRVPGLVGSRDERDRPLTALSQELVRAAAPEVRRTTLAVLAGLAPGTSPHVDQVRAVLAWRAPRRGGWLRDELVAWTLREAELLGVTGLGALAAPARALLDGAPDRAIDSLEALLPDPLDHVLLQADLTAVAPGPLEPALARELALLADVESKGGATVYRFSEASVRRGLDSGRSADDVHRFLHERSRTPVPQPLTYLVDDVARRHGRVRVGGASAYLRCDDDSLLATIAADRRTASLGLRRLAPTILVATAPPDLVLERLRAAGYAPAAESADGTVVVRRPESLRAPATGRPGHHTGEPSEPGDRLVAATVRAVRSGDAAPRGTETADGELAGLRRTTPTETLAVLRDAAREGAALWIGYVNAEGQSRVRVIEPIRVEGGQVSAFDHLRQQVRTFAVHRITGLAEVTEGVGAAGSGTPGSNAAGTGTTGRGQVSTK